MELTQKQKAFAQAYFENGHNATEAARTAGYSERTAAAQGSRLAKQEKVRERVRELETEAFANRGITREWIGNKYADIVERCMQGTPHMTWNPETREKEPDGLWVFDPGGAAKGLDGLCKLLGIAKEDEKPEEVRLTIVGMAAEDAMK